MPLILENAPNVTFSEVAGLFIASFQRPTALETPDTTQETTQETTQDTTQEPPRNTKKHQDTPRKCQETPRKRQENAKENTRKILLRRLRQQPDVTMTALAQAVGLSADGVKYHLAQLKRAGKLRRHGSTKGGYWEVIGEP
jgi:ATP-dependent DNA helicase RecG